MERKQCTSQQIFNFKTAGVVSLTISLIYLSMKFLFFCFSVSLFNEIYTKNKVFEKCFVVTVQQLRKYK